MIAPVESEVKVYNRPSPRLTRFSSIVLFIGGILAWLMMGGYSSENEDWDEALLVGAIPVTIAIAMRMRNPGDRVEIDGREVRYLSRFKKIFLPLNEIKGFSVIESTRTGAIFVLVPKSKHAPLIRITGQSEGWEEIIAWARGNLQELGEANRKKGEQRAFNRDTVAQNVSLATAQEKQDTRLTRSDKLCLALHAALLLIAFLGGIFDFLRSINLAWSDFTWFPRTCLPWILLAFPWVTLYLISTSGGAMQFYFGLDTRTVGLTFAAPLFVPMLFLAYSASCDWHILDWTNFWLPFAALSAVMFAGVLVFGRGNREREPWLWGGCCLAYGYAAAILLNGLLVTDPPTHYEALVVQKRSNGSRKHPSYYLRLGPWGQCTVAKGGKVPKYLWDRYQEGQHVEISMQIGRFGIPFYWIR